jgi:hypothetical protein
MEDNSILFEIGWLKFKISGRTAILTATLVPAAWTTGLVTLFNDWPRWLNVAIHYVWP